MARRADIPASARGLDFAVSTPAARARNGRYRGPAKVREIPPGVTGADLARSRRVALAVGQIWRRGPQRVRIARLTREDVWFRELSHGRALRRAARWFFLSESLPEQALRSNDGVDE